MVFILCLGRMFACSYDTILLGLETTFYSKLLKIYYKYVPSYNLSEGFVNKIFLIFHFNSMFI